MISAIKYLGGRALMICLWLGLSAFVSFLVVGSMLTVYREFGPVVTGVIVVLIVACMLYGWLKKAREMNNLDSCLRQAKKESLEEWRRAEEYRQALKKYGYFEPDLTPEGIARTRELEAKVNEVRKRLNLK